MAGKSAGFAIGIGIQDAASAGLDAINKRIAAMQAPAERFNKSLAKFGEVTGINRAAEGMATLGDRALGAARAVERLAGPMAGITGAASLGGIVELTRRWADAGNTIGKTANLLNTPVARLSAWENAAKQAGSSADKLDSSWAGMSKTLNDAFWNKPGDSQMRLRTLGIDWRDAQGNIKTTEAALRELADKVATYKDPRAQAHALEFGSVDTDLLRLFQNGQKGLDEFLRQANETGANWTKEMSDHAVEVEHAWSTLELSFEGAGHRIADSWHSTTTSVLDDISHWVEGFQKLSDAQIKQATGAAAVFGALAATKPALWMLRFLGLLGPGELLGAAAVIGEGGSKLPPRASDSLTRELNTPWTHVNPDGTIGAGPSSGSPSSDDYRPSWWETHAPTWLGGASSGSRHNPLNLRFAGQTGASPTASGFGAYTSDEQGVAAAERQLLLYRGRHITSLRDIISTWAPPGDHNDTEAYIARVAASTGWRSDQQIDVSDPAQAGRLIAAMAPNETHALDPAVVGRGVAAGLGRLLDPGTVGGAAGGAGHVRVDVHLHGAPAGTTASATATGPVTVGAPRVETGMAFAR